MKKFIVLGLLILSGLFVTSSSAQSTYQQDRYDQNQDYRYNRRHRRYDNRGYNSNAYIVREQQFYVREYGRVYLDTYRVVYTRRGQYVRSVRIRRERVSRYDRYDDYRFRRETGRGFGVNFTFNF
jgi:hypothetical protein